MAGSVDDIGGEVDGAPPDSWEVADLDAAVSRLMLHSKRESNNSSPNSTTVSSELTSDSSAPMRSLSGGLFEDMVNSVDQFLCEALQNPRERLSVLRLEQDVEKFMKDPSRQQMEFQQLPTSYLRLAAHRIAQHYSLQSTALPDNNVLEGPGSRIIIYKTSNSCLPLIRLADIPVKLPTDDSPNNVVKVAIKQRPNKKSQILETNSNSQRSNNLKSVEERKEEYNRARARIFSSTSSTSGGKQESASRLQEVFHHGSVGALKEEVSYSTGMNMSSGRSSVTGTGPASRIRTWEPIRSRSNSKVAIFRDHEVERNDPDYDRSYDRYAQRFDPGFGFNGGSYPIQPMYTPVLTYNTEFPQLGSNHTHRSPLITTEQHQPHTLAQHVSGPWVAPSPPAGLGYRPPESTGAPFNSNHGSMLYTQYPSQHTGATYIHPHEQIHLQLAQSEQQSDTSYGLAHPR
ncbi:hypothetical protein R6Q57_003014 [Mikania cordata]